MRLTVTPAISNDTTADRMVIPRWRSKANVSVCVVPASTSPTALMTPAAYSSRWVSVAFPASTGASPPKLSVPRDNRHTLRRDQASLFDRGERRSHVVSLVIRRLNHLARVNHDSRSDTNELTRAGR